MSPTPHPPHPLDGHLDGALAVVTGQQAGLFGGPLFTLGKVLGAVALARARGARPVFWIECDDADIREVDQAVLLDGEGEPRTLTLAEPDDGRPVAARRLGSGIEALLAEVEALLGPGERALAALADLRRAYRPGEMWPDAFRNYLATLTAGLGVVFIDPSTRAIKHLAEPFFARVLAHADDVLAAIEQGAGLLPDPQVPYLPGELPLFVLDGEGRRRKLERHESGGGFALKGGGATFTRKALLDLLAAEPERFSAGVLLRPVLQDWLLPTVAYVAGPSESRYHEQIGPLYRTLGVSKPEVVPRPRLVLVEARVRRSIEKLGATLGDALEGEAALRQRAVRVRSGIDPRAEAETTIVRLRAELAALRERLVAIDPGQLTRPFDEAEAGIAYHVQKAGARAAAAIERKDEELVRHAHKVAQLLVPGGVPQERVYPVVPFLARMSREELVAAILGAIDPADPGKQIVIDL